MKHALTIAYIYNDKNKTHKNNEKSVAKFEGNVTN